MLAGIIKIVIYAVMAYTVVSLSVYFLQPGMLYYPNLPSRDLVSSPRDIGLDYRNVEFISADKVKLHGWYIPHPQPQATLLFFHGNAGNISHRLDSINIFHQLGLNVFIIDYRGYGNSEGEPTELGTYRDAEAAWHYLTHTLGEKSSDIIVFGRSLGGAIASWLATQHSPRALILESSFSSARSIGQHFYPMLPIEQIIRFNYDTQSHVEKTNCPVLIAHSPDDDIIPYAEGRKIFVAAGKQKTFLEMRGDHNSGFLLSGDIYIDGLRQFIQSLPH